MKSLLVIIFIFASFTVSAKSVEDTILKVEAKKDAKCTYQSSSMSYCLGNAQDGSQVCRRTLRFSCLPNEVSQKEFRLKLRTVKVGFQVEQVRKIIYIY